MNKTMRTLPFSRKLSTLNYQAFFFLDLHMALICSNTQIFFESRKCPKSVSLDAFLY